MTAGGKTAKELMEQLKADPDFLAKKAKNDAQFEELERICEADEYELICELNSRGFHVKSVWDLVNNAPHEFLERNFVGSYEDAYPILVKHLTISHHQRIREGIIRALTEKNAKRIAFAPLLEQLNLEPLKCNRWVIANALRTMLTKAERAKYPEVDEAYGAGYL